MAIRSLRFAERIFPPHRARSDLAYLIDNFTICDRISKCQHLTKLKSVLCARSQSIDKSVQLFWLFDLTQAMHASGMVACVCLSKSFNFIACIVHIYFCENMQLMPRVPSTIFAQIVILFIHAYDDLRRTDFLRL